MRMQLELPNQNVKVVKYLMELANFKTYKELFNAALTVLYWCLNEVTSGRIIVSLDEQTGKYKELSMPAFQVATFQAHQAPGERAATAR